VLVLNDPPAWEYMVFLFRKIPPVSEQELMEAGYRDYLQAGQCTLTPG